MRRFLGFGVLLAAVSAPALAVNFSGKWAIQRGPRASAMVVVLNQVGNEVRGEILAVPEPWDNSPLNDGIWGGKVEGDALSFYVWTGTDQPAKVSYRGTMAASGEEIVFTVTSGSAAGQTVTARRVK